MMGCTEADLRRQIEEMNEEMEGLDATVANLTADRDQWYELASKMMQQKVNPPVVVMSQTDVEKKYHNLLDAYHHMRDIATEQAGRANQAKGWAIVGWVCFSISVIVPFVI